MAKTSMSYDHNVYTTPYVFSGGSTVGASGVTTKFAAFTAMKIKAVQYSANTAGTSSTTPLLFTKSGTTTATSTLTAIASAAVTAVDLALATPVTLAAGDQFWCTHGTDATIAVSFAIETLVIPGSNVTQ
jgi:hypothetical protein